MGVFKDKDYDGILKIMSEISDTLITFTPENARGLSSSELKVSADTYFDYVQDGVSAENAIELAKEGIYKGNIDKRNDLWNRNESKYHFITVYIDMPREKLYERINMRVDLMRDGGVVKEAEMLKQMNLSPKNTALQAIGYKEFFDYIDGKETLDQALEKLKQSTRRYAKRQITWFKKLHCDIIYNNMTKEELIEEIKRIMYGETKNKE